MRYFSTACLVLLARMIIYFLSPRVKNSKRVEFKPICLPATNKYPETLGHLETKLFFHWMEDYGVMVLYLLIMLMFVVINVVGVTL